MRHQDVMMHHGHMHGHAHPATPTQMPFLHPPHPHQPPLPTPQQPTVYSRPEVTHQTIHHMVCIIYKKIGFPVEDINLKVYTNCCK